ncbi:hypothetical protein [Pilimelia columellifera]|uniref:Uncharacterized protein n=1 Tax=Pilimelia columellifera subsp. columellifera TaxID=706583 RepID=A0ABN3NI71_9ACTN
MFHNPMYERLLKRWQEVLPHIDDPEARRQHDRVKALIVSRTKRSKLERYFDAKVDYLIENGRIEGVEGKVLKKLHGYRNELYHRDRLREDTVHTAGLLYFELACSLFERGDGYPINDPIGPRASPQLDRYNDPGDKGGVPSSVTIAAKLRHDIGLDGISLNEALRAHLTSRLNKVDEDVEWVSEMLAGFDRDLVIRLAQVHENALPDSPHQLHALELTYQAADLDRLRHAVEGMQVITDKFHLFAAFAEIENTFEPLEILVSDLAERIDHEIEMLADIQRGK